MTFLVCSYQAVVLSVVYTLLVINAATGEGEKQMEIWNRVENKIQSEANSIYNNNNTLLQKKINNNNNKKKKNTASTHIVFCGFQTNIYT